MIVDIVPIIIPAKSHFNDVIMPLGGFSFTSSSSCFVADLLAESSLSNSLFTMLILSIWRS